MKLYYYEHCPFSARVRMILNLKGIKAEQVVLPADDEQTISQLIGKHQIPVLQRDDGSPMADSMDIVRYLDSLDGQPIIREPDTPALHDWLDSFVPNLQYLGYPRWTQIGLEEFASPSAYAHFREKKSQTIGDFDAALSHTEAKAREVAAQLERLPQIIDLTPTHQQPRWDDVTLFPMLRSLSVVKAVQWPAEVRAYTVTQAQRCGLDTFFDRAC
ncbi:glutaredoxin 2 [Pseudomonas stutzeri]|uniref:Glutaredoxin, GrxB family n=1 Tax=Stutzerimonas stutzeri TaxID=316 RepID=A0A2N8S0D3_STUST|nr:glutaredoxin 2 [Stutzerimonas stutzeri]MCQ4295399.1 glutaredoxin 2 [Stutzerimonas stutzeri]PNF80046.1 glutaredoxin, GrxB family [Stutzerimonas stutzeri]